jgi:transposase
MDYYAGIDVSLEQSSVCIVNEQGKIMREAKTSSEPEALAELFTSLGLPLTRVGMEAGPLSQWLHEGLVAAGYDVVLMETRQVKAALSAMTVKTDRKDARGIAQMLRMGWYRSVHRKSLAAQEIRTLLVARKLLVSKIVDVEMTVRGLLRGFGLKVGTTTKPKFAARVRELTAGQETLELVIEPLLRCRDVLREEMAGLHRKVLGIVRADELCRRLMTAPGVGAVTALTFRAGVDDPTRFTSSRAVGAHFGLTPRRYQSGEIDIIGSITKAGDKSVRSALYEAALSLLIKVQRPSAMKAWGLAVAKRRGLKRAVVAVARKLAVALHRMWVDGTEFRWSKETALQPDVAAVA